MPELPGSVPDQLTVKVAGEVAGRAATLVVGAWLST